MILSLKDFLMLTVLLVLITFAVLHLVKHARYADSLFGNLVEETN